MNVRGLLKPRFPVLIVLVSLLHCVCAGAHPHGDEGPSAYSMLPNELTGVWHRDDEGGRENCRSYRDAKPNNELIDDQHYLIGSLIITRNLVHAYSEYGEGNFYAVKRVRKTGSRRCGQSDQALQD
ncbi:MAG: hypothetical protein ABI858_06420 [Pseudoxanthomonas sp.]